MLRGNRRATDSDCDSCTGTGSVSLFSASDLPRTEYGGKVEEEAAAAEAAGINDYSWRLQAH